MQITEGKIPGLYLLTPRVFEDERGYFYESYNQDVFEQKIKKIRWVQDNESGSVKNVFRGFHYQVPPFAQAKLVRVSRGKVLDIAIDIRPDSPTFGQSESVILSEENKLQFFIPAGFAHGYLVLSEKAVFNYKCDDFYHPEAEGGISYRDPNLKIDWPLPVDELIVSRKDKQLPELTHHRPFKD